MTDEEFLKFHRNHRKIGNEDRLRLGNLGAENRSKIMAPVCSSTPSVKDRLGAEGKMPKVAEYPQRKDADYRNPHRHEYRSSHSERDRHISRSSNKKGDGDLYAGAPTATKKLSSYWTKERN